MERFKTPDTSLAAYLYSTGEKYLAIELEDGRGFFIFENSPTLGQRVIEWGNGNASKQYYDSYRLMLRFLNDEKRNNKPIT